MLLFPFFPKENVSGEVGKTGWNWLKTVYLTSIVFLLPQFPSSEYSSFSTCPGYRAQRSSECLQLWTSFFRQPSKQTVLHFMLPLWRGQAHQQQVTIPAARWLLTDWNCLQWCHKTGSPRTWVLSPHDTNKVNMLCYSPPKIQDLCKMPLFSDSPSVLEERAIFQEGIFSVQWVCVI